jgi:hypothetical protein
MSQKYYAPSWFRKTSGVHPFNRRGTQMFALGTIDDAKNNIWSLLFP